MKYTYDDWGNVEKFEQDRNSTITAMEDTGAYGYYDIDYTYGKATTGRNTVRRTTMDLPDTTTVTYEYTDLTGLHYEDVSRPRPTHIVVMLIRTSRVVVIRHRGGIGHDLPPHYLPPSMLDSC